MYLALFEPTIQPYRWFSSVSLFLSALRLLAPPAVTLLLPSYAFQRIERDEMRIGTDCYYRTLETDLRHIPLRVAPAPPP